VYRRWVPRMEIKWLYYETFFMAARMKFEAIVDWRKTDV